MIQGGAVKINGEKVDEDGPFLAEWVVDGGAVLRVGKKRAARIVVG